jgi:hypothetical protein
MIAPSRCHLCETDAQKQRRQRSLRSVVEAVLSQQQVALRGGKPNLHPIYHALYMTEQNGASFEDLYAIFCDQVRFVDRLPDNDSRLLYAKCLWHAFRRRTEHQYPPVRLPSVEEIVEGKFRGVNSKAQRAVYAWCQTSDPNISIPLDMVFSPDENGENVFHYLAFWGHAELCERLLHAGSSLGTSVRQQSRWCTEPSQVACVADNLPVLQWLWSKDPSILEAKSTTVPAGYLHHANTGISPYGNWRIWVNWASNLFQLCVRGNSLRCFCFVLHHTVSCIDDLAGLLGLDDASLRLTTAELLRHAAVTVPQPQGLSKLERIELLAEAFTGLDAFDWSSVPPVMYYACRRESDFQRAVQAKLTADAEYRQHFEPCGQSTKVIQDSLSRAWGPLDALAPARIIADFLIPKDASLAILDNPLFGAQAEEMLRAAASRGVDTMLASCQGHSPEETDLDDLALPEEDSDDDHAEARDHAWVPVRSPRPLLSRD